jgi:hypothetical protein
MKGERCIVRSLITLYHIHVWTRISIARGSGFKTRSGLASGVA